MDLSAVGVILSGRLFYAPDGSPIPAKADLGSAAWELPVPFIPAGLFPTDGGFESVLEPSGDPTAFFQDGYSLPTGLATATLKVALAQTDDRVRALLWGRVPDANGVIDIDAGGHATRYVLYAEEIFKDGRIRRRIGPIATVKSVTEVKSERGAVKGYEVTFAFARSSDLDGNGHLREALLAAA